MVFFSPASPTTMIFLILGHKTDNNKKSILLDAEMEYKCEKNNINETYNFKYYRIYDNRFLCNKQIALFHMIKQNSKKYYRGRKYSGRAQYLFRTLPCLPVMFFTTFSCPNSTAKNTSGVTSFEYTHKSLI